MEKIKDYSKTGSKSIDFSTHYHLCSGKCQKDSKLLLDTKITVAVGLVNDSR